MQIKLAKSAGFCFGVKNIDKLAEKLTENKDKKLFSYGPLIHNPQYIKKREKDGIKVLNGLDDLPLLSENSAVILRAHGVTKKEREALEKTGATIIDGTCPVLLNIYKKAKLKVLDGYRVVIVGSHEHPEVKAMVSYMGDDAIVIQTEEEAKKFFSNKKIYIISQTTNRDDYFKNISDILLSNNEGIFDITICKATGIRQTEAQELAKNSDLMLVIGGGNSSNTEKLRQVCSKYCDNVIKTETFTDIILQKSKIFNKIGVTAGASTPDWIIEEVVKGMDNITQAELMEQIEDSMVKIYPRDIVKGEVIAVKDDEVYVDIHYRSDGIIKNDEMTDEECENPKNAFHEGEEIDVYVIKLDDGEGNVVLSTRRVEGLKHWNKLVEEFEAGNTVEGYVSGSNRGGLVVKAMGVNGFIPASQITTYYVKNFKQFVGQTLECKIVSVDERKRRVVLSSRAVKEEQLDGIWDKIVVGEKVKGKVVRMTDFGAFIDLGGVDGLIHVSDIAWQRINKPSDVLEVGQEIEPVVLKANRERNRISLGLKQLMPKPFDVFMENNKPGDVVKGKVVNMLDFGAFIRLSEGVEGLIHVSQISNHHVEKPSDEFNIGQEVEVKILEIDTEHQRIALSSRALLEPEKKEEGRTSAQDPTRYERESKPKTEEKKERPKKKQEKKAPKLDFSTSSDIGTNLGDLIAAQLNMVEDSAEDTEEVGTEAEESTEETSEE